jgi:flagellar FliJ protein
MVDRKTHEKLKEHKFEEFKRELAVEENKEIDQLVSYKFNNE